MVNGLLGPFGFGSFKELVDVTYDFFCLHCLYTGGGFALLQALNSLFRNFFMSCLGLIGSQRLVTFVAHNFHLSVD